MSSRANGRALGSFNKAHIWLLTICLLAESSMVLPPYTAAAHKHPLKPHFCVPILSQRSQSRHLILNISSHKSNNCDGLKILLRVLLNLFLGLCLRLCPVLLNLFLFFFFSSSQSKFLTPRSQILSEWSRTSETAKYGQCVVDFG